jgi:hypothetical protein
VFALFLFFARLSRPRASFQSFCGPNHNDWRDEMYKPDSDYARNVHSQNIVYLLADGSTIELAPEDCPDFDRWKALSDEDYHQRKLHDQRTTRMDVPLYEDAVGLLDEPFEDVLEPHTVDEALAVLEKCLTETQRRRYLLHTRDGKSTRHIAQSEGVSQHAIMDSLQESERRIKKFLKSTFSNGQKNEDK